MNDQRKLSKLLVEELRKRGALEDIICEYEIETVRECSYCHRLMDEGWIYEGFETFCSDRCLLSANPSASINELRTEANNDDSNTYWTRWEG